MPATSVYPAREVLDNDELQPQSSVVEASLPGAERTRGVDDDYLYELKTKAVLPTHEQIGIKLAADVDAQAAAESWLTSFARAAEAGDATGFTNAFASFGHWRDRVAFTWSFRTFNETDSIRQAAQDTVGSAEANSFKLIEPKPALQTPYPDLSYIQAHFEFKTALVRATGVVNLIPTSDGSYEAWTLTTAAEELLKFPELEQADGHVMGALSWEKLRRKEAEFETEDPEVVVIGAGHNGLSSAARLQALGVKVLVIDREVRIGDNWRLRYEALSLHFPHWADHLAYMPFPPNWPVYCPAAKLGNWLESYADVLDLSVWTSTTIEEAVNNDKDWTLRVVRGGEERILKPKHVVCATSLFGAAMLPQIKGMDEFKGVIKHSTAHTNSSEYVGKKALVVGTSSSGFDTAFEFARRGIDVTILQRSPTYIMSLTNAVPMNLGNLYMAKGAPPLEHADRIAQSMPTAVGEAFARRNTAKLAEQDAELLAGLKAKGLRTWPGQRDAGTYVLGNSRGGGFYFDAGACQAVLDGKIKVESGYIDHFTSDTVVLNGDREQKYDVVVMATGFTNVKDNIRRILGDTIGDQLTQIWGIDGEGELYGAWRDCGVPRLWLQVGTLMQARYYARIVALRIKAELEGLAPAPYAGARP